MNEHSHVHTKELHCPMRDCTVAVVARYFVIERSSRIGIREVTLHFSCPIHQIDVQMTGPESTMMALRFRSVDAEADER